MEINGWGLFKIKKYFENNGLEYCFITMDSKLDYIYSDLFMFIS